MNALVRKSSGERRKEIVAAVLRIIGHKGFKAVTARALAEEVGVTSGALFRHFTSLDDILQEVVRYALTRVEGTFPDESLPPRDRLVQLARNRIQVFGADPGLAWLLRSEQAYLMLPKESGDLLRALTRRSKQYLLDAIREGVSEGSIRSDIEPEVLLVLIMGTIHALIGMPGVYRIEVNRQPGESDRVLRALVLLLADPDRRAESSGEPDPQESIV
ncbi:MAG: TetR/AcrR family transcriptional regulator [Gemmatimonadota bacterium]